MIRVVGYALTIVLIAAAVFAAEFGLRWYGLGDPLLYYENTSYRYALRPDQQSQRLRGATVTIDSAGLRSATDWTEPADVKILFIGDSVTYGGSNTDDRELFSELVCARLSERFQQSFNCGNAGTNAYGVENMTARLLYDPAAADADVIVVTVTSGDASRGLQPLRALPFFAKAPPQPIPAISELLAYVVDQVRQELRFRGAPPPPVPDQEAETTRRRLDELFTALRQMRAQGKRILLVHTPNRTEVAQGYSPAQTTREAMSGSSLDLVEMREHLQGRDLDEIYYDNVHLDPEGHRIYGDVLAERIAELLEVTPSNRSASRGSGNGDMRGAAYR